MRNVKPHTLLKIMLLILIINALISGGAFQYFLLFAMLSTILFNYFYIQINQKNISHLFFSSTESGTVGEQLRVEYKLTNNGFIPIMNSQVTMFISRRLGDSKYPVENLIFKPFQFTNLKHDITLKHHGYYRLGKIQVDMKDPLRLFSRRVVFDREINLTIYPRIFEIEKFPLPHRELFGNRDVKLKAYEDFTNIKNSREYVPGDSYKKIHWKLTAKTDKLYVKEYNLSASGKVYIYLDCYKENYSEKLLFDQDEKIVEIAGSLVKFYLKNRFEVSLVYLDGNRKKMIGGKSLRQFDLFLKALTGFTPNAEINMTRFLQNETGKLSYGATVVVITPKVDHEMSMLLTQMRRKKFVLQLITLDHLKSHLDQLDGLGIRYQSIGLNDDIRGRLEAFR
jgi:uncharacterized protein (DUF58 family)